MKIEDFKAEINHKGYMIFYKGNPIGGAGTLPSSKPKHWRHKRADVKMYTEQSDREIEQLVQGNGQQRFVDVINKINKGA